MPYASRGPTQTSSGRDSTWDGELCSGDRLLAVGLLPLAALASTAIEYLVLTKRFRIDRSPRNFNILLIANVMTTPVALVVFSLYI